MNLLRTITKAIGSKLKPVRFFSQEEWNNLTPKEKVWITNKHHKFLRDIGDGEVNFFQGILYQIFGFMAFIKIMEYPEWIIYLFPLGWIIINYIQWWFGNFMDKYDLPAFNTEIVNRRNMVFREIRDPTYKKRMKDAKGN